jgi:Fe-S-cluster containining protein
MTVRSRQPDDPDELAITSAWLDHAAVGSAASAELEGIYARASAEIAGRGPACWASGRCCNFAKAGHRLYVTGLEAAYCVRRLEPAMALTREGIAIAREGGGCPFQVANLCGVHAIKPLGCRVYFCDRSAQGWQGELTERLLGEIRGVHERHGLGYRYGEWREMLERVGAAMGID